ncbi:response regulator transcription factor [Actinomycetospora endophytica]|uniref:Response regulator transcription factor n=1 Tax=Actinomycetospora endophytica TaxID=2291215 RepID=A0ABS8PDY0_9PSEU|nr:response regulator transcription factor [Actinomycetospora endophytica]MCD2196198.1 response regulator transcription factor [Actinomycetospora endophytica]
MHRVVLVDDHRLIATTLTASLRSAGLDVHWCAAPGPELDALLDGPPGLALLDLDLGEDADGGRLDGVDLVRPIAAGGWTVVMITGATDEERLADALAEGAIGWVHKNAAFDDLVAVCTSAAEGESILPLGERRRLLARRRSRQADRKVYEDLLDRLTPREREVLHALSEGSHVAEIASRSHVSVATVRSQVQAIREKLEVASQLEAAALYRATR